MNSQQISNIKYLGIDSGGTFTDFVLFDGIQWRVHKVLSTPENPAMAIIRGINELELDADVKARTLFIAHGSTVATNAALERKGAKTVYIGNKGFKDLLTIGRQARTELYNLKPVPSQPPVPDFLCLEVDTRRDANGRLLKALSDHELNKLCNQIDALKPEAIAINLLYSFLNDQEEVAIETALKDRYFTSISSHVLPIYKEYERGMATWLNASLGPKVMQYMQSLMAKLDGCSVSVMQSSGGTLAIDQAANRAVNLLLSGPAGGLAAVRHIAEQCQTRKIISFDMGGTSTDVALMDGDFTQTDEGRINQWPIAIPMLDIETIGAGGGSIAWVDKGRMLHVGPQSAGSDPGPACYGRGGLQATVSDANVVLGRLLPDSFLAGRMPLDADKAITAMTGLAGELQLSVIETAEGILRVAEYEMIQALHRISIKKGHDPAEFTLCSFGGAGGLHVCSLAEQLRISSAIVPANSGVLSALGMLTAPVKRQKVHTFMGLWDQITLDEIEAEYQRLEGDLIRSVKSELPADRKINVRRTLDLRYLGQSFSLNLPFDATAADRFVIQHEKQYGHTLNQPVELVNLCVDIESPSTIRVAPIQNQSKASSAPSLSVRVAGEDEAIPVFERSKLSVGEQLSGPALITEDVSTTWLKRGWYASVDTFGNLMLIHK